SLVYRRGIRIFHRPHLFGRGSLPFRALVFRLDLRRASLCWDQPASIGRVRTRILDPRERQDDRSLDRLLPGGVSQALAGSARNVAAKLALRTKHDATVTLPSTSSNSTRPTNKH